MGARQTSRQLPTVTRSGVHHNGTVTIGPCCTQGSPGHGHALSLPIHKACNRAKLAAATPAQLETWGDRMLEAKSLDEVFGETRH